MARTLSHQESRSFYDRFGARQDRQGWYEEVAISRLVEHSALEQATAVVELGCGTGKLAARWLSRHLPAEAGYLGLDSSTTMVDLARAKLAPFGARAQVRLTDGSLAVDAASAVFDRFVSCYVLDLLSEDDIHRVLGEAARLVVAGGRLCLAGLTFGSGFGAALVSGLWTRVHALRPSLVGGCRPLELVGALDSGAWRVEHRSVVCRWGLSSEVLVAVRRRAID